MITERIQSDKSELLSGGALSRILDFLLIPVFCFIVFIKAYGIFDLYIFIIAVTLIYSIKQWCANHDQFKARRFDWLDLSALLVAMSEVISYATSTYQPNSLQYLAEALFLFLFYYLIRFNLNHDYQRLAIFLAISLLGFWISSRGLYSFWRHYERVSAAGFSDLTNFKNLFGFVRAAGNATGERITIFVLFLPFPLILFYKFKESKLLRWIFLSPVITLLLILSVSFSRAVYAALLVFFLAGSILFYRHKLLSAKRIILFNLLLAVMLAVCLTPIAKPVLTTASMLKTQSQVRSVEGRMHLWRATFDIIERHPLTGIGSHNFPMQYAAYTEDHAALVVSSFNYFLQILVERGALGLLAYCLLIFAFFKAVIGNLRLAESEFHKAAAILFMACFAAVIVRDLTYSSILVNRGANTLLWFMFAAIARPVERARL